MLKQNKIIDKSPFYYYNANPKGRKTDDCVVRAIATATGKSWEDTLRGLTECAIKYGYMINTVELYDKYLKELGWVKQKQPRKRDNKRYRAKEFVKVFKGTAVVNLGQLHVGCVKDGQVWDIWDSSNEVIGNYWVKIDKNI